MSVQSYLHLHIEFSSRTDTELHSADNKWIWNGSWTLSSLSSIFAWNGLTHELFGLFLLRLLDSLFMTGKSLFQVYWRTLRINVLLSFFFLDTEKIKKEKRKFIPEPACAQSTTFIPIDYSPLVRKRQNCWREQCGNQQSGSVLRKSAKKKLFASCGIVWSTNVLCGTIATAQCEAREQFVIELPSEHPVR